MKQIPKVLVTSRFLFLAPEANFWKPANRKIITLYLDYFGVLKFEYRDMKFCMMEVLFILGFQRNFWHNPISCCSSWSQNPEVIILYCNFTLFYWNCPIFYMFIYRLARNNFQSFRINPLLILAPGASFWPLLETGPWSQNSKWSGTKNLGYHCR